MMRAGDRVVLAVLVVTVGAPLAAQEGGPDVPTALFLHYNCKPDKRAAFRAHMEGPGVAQFDNWKKQGVFKDYLILFSTFANPVWDMLVRLDFEKYVDTDRWRAIERTTPGGLSPQGLALCSPTNAHLADLMFEKSQPTRDRATARYTVFTFEFRESRAAYKNYFTARPKFDLDGSVEDGRMTAYAIYANQYHLGPAWDILWLLEYRDSLALGSREIMRQAVRKRDLETIPGFAYARASGGEVHSLEQSVIADPILPR